MHAILSALYSGTRTVEVHSAAHADPAYRRSSTGQRLQHTLAYNPHKCIFVHMCLNMCVTEREGRTRGRECRQQWSACLVTRRTRNAERCGQSQFGNSSVGIYFITRWSDSPSLHCHNGFANTTSVKQNTCMRMCVLVEQEKCYNFLYLFLLV